VIFAVAEMGGGAGLVTLRFGGEDYVRRFGHGWTIRLHRTATTDLAVNRLLADMRHLSTPSLVLLGIGLFVYGLVKVGLITAALLGHRRFAAVGAAVFAVIAIAGAVVLVSDPTPARIALAALDVAVAAALLVEAREPTAGESSPGAWPRTPSAARPA
jgi:hypothetical protein